MALKLLLVALTVTAVTAYKSKCPGWDTCSIYTEKELSTIYFNSKYCLNLVPEKMVYDGFDYGEVREVCLNDGLDILNFGGAPKEDEAEEISECVYKYFGISVAAPTYTCLQQALSKDIKDMEQIPYSATQKQTIMDIIDKCIEQVPVETARSACRAEAESQLNTDTEWKANLPDTVINCFYDRKDGVPDYVLVATNDCLNKALEVPLQN